MTFLLKGEENGYYKKMPVKKMLLYSSLVASFDKEFGGNNTESGLTGLPSFKNGPFPFVMFPR